MRILIIGINFEPELTGIAPYTSALAHHLSERHDVTVLTGVPHYPEWSVPTAYRHWRTVERSGRLRVIRLRHFVPRRPGVLGRSLYELSFAVRAAIAGLRLRPDAVIAVVPALLGGHAARLIARRGGVAYGVLAQDVMSNAAAQSGTRGGRLVAGLTARLERSVLRAAASIVTIHPRLADELAVLARSKIIPTVIYNWTHTGAAGRDRQSARAHFGWAEDRVIAMHSGNMGAKQNLEVVIEAARLAVESYPGIQFVLAGEGNQRRMLERYAADCPSITFLDSVPEDDYSDLLRAADILLVNERPGMQEMSLPSKLTSYLSAARPVVAATDST